MIPEVLDGIYVGVIIRLLPSGKYWVQTHFGYLAMTSDEKYQIGENIYFELGTNDPIIRGKAKQVWIKVVN